MEMLLIGEDDEPDTTVAGAIACVSDGEDLIVVGRSHIERVMIAVVSQASGPHLHGRGIRLVGVTGADLSLTQDHHVTLLTNIWACDP
jgi:hypothetical protein